MAPSLILALAMLAGDDSPVITQRVPTPVVAPPSRPRPTAPLVPYMAMNTGAPSDDYGYVAWCYGALGTYVALYDQVMPEISRIEHTFPGPDGVEAAMKVYPNLRALARADLKTYAAAIDAAEKASPKSISAYGQAQAKKGVLIWGGAGAVPKADLARMWMSWSPPDKCETTAKSLKAHASVLGQALAANTPDADSDTAVSPPPAAESIAPAAAAPVAIASNAPPAAAPSEPVAPAPSAAGSLVVAAPAVVEMSVASASATPTAPPPTSPAPPARTPPPAISPPPVVPFTPEPPVQAGSAEDLALWYRGVP